MRFNEDEEQYDTIPQVIEGLKRRFSAKIKTREDRNFISERCKLLREGTSLSEVSFQLKNLKEEKIIITIRYDFWNRIFYIYCSDSVKAKTYVNFSKSRILQ